MNRLVDLEVVSGAGHGEEGREDAPRAELPPAEVLIVGCFQGEAPAADGLPEELARAAARSAARPGFEGREKQRADGSLDDAPIAALSVHGLGRRDALDGRSLAAWLERTLDSLRIDGVGRALWAVPDADEARGEAAAERICRRLSLGAYRFDRYKARPPRRRCGSPGRVSCRPPARRRPTGRRWPPWCRWPRA